MTRSWLLTWTTYGTWLPGDPRGFVSNVRDGPGPEVRHNRPGTPYDADDPRVRRRALANLVGTPVFLAAHHASLLAEQFRQTAAFRGWTILAGAIMTNHVHLVVRVPGDPDPAGLLHDFKSYGTRRLQQAGMRPTGARWWTHGGSRRKLPDEHAVAAAIRYVLNQPHALITWKCDVDDAASPASGAAPASGVCEYTPASGVCKHPAHGVDTPCSPPDTPCSPTDTPCSPTDTPCSPPDTPCSPPDTPCSPTDTPCSPTGTPCSPTEDTP